MTGSADNSAKLWEVSTGKELYSWEFPTAVKRVAWSSDDSQLLLITEARSGYKGTIQVFTVNRDAPAQQQAEPVRTITFHGPKPTVAAFGPLDEYIVTAHENGKVAKYYHDKQEPESGIDAELEERATDAHPGFSITDIQFSADRTYFVTSSKDKNAKVSGVSSSHKRPLGSQTT